jgi:L-histidine N-alpha-methyltransferase
VSADVPDGSTREFATAVMTGLSDRPRWLPCRYLYDETGSRLFDEICLTPEYYLTRTESAIIAESAAAISEETGPVTLVELGSGSAGKTAHLLDAYVRLDPRTRYVPVDVSQSALELATRATTRRHPQLAITAVHGTYDAAFPMLSRVSPAMLVFLGSTIGNFNQTEAAAFWHKVAVHLAPGDFVLVGVDLVKDAALLNAAYNDAAGLSARFTKNIFARMNRELGAGLDLDQIDHVAGYDAEWQRVEIYARFIRAQSITLGPLGRSIQVAAGDRIMTEISRKFVLDDLEQYLECFGLQVRRVFTDPRRWFADVLLQNVKGIPIP